jgi:hypothetical protein
VFGDAQMDGMFGAVELRLRLDVIKRRAHGRGAGGAPGCCVIPAPQPNPKAGAANGPGFPVPINCQIREGRPTGVWKSFALAAKSTSMSIPPTRLAGAVRR